MTAHMKLLDAMGTMPERFAAELADADAFDPAVLEGDAAARRGRLYRFAALGGLAACIAVLLAAGLYLRGIPERESGVTPPKPPAITEITCGTAQTTQTTPITQSETETAAALPSVQTETTAAAEHMTETTAKTTVTEPDTQPNPPAHTAEPYRTQTDAAPETVSTHTTTASVTAQTDTAPATTDAGTFDPSYPYLRIVFTEGYDPDPADYAEFGSLTYFAGHWELEITGGSREEITQKAQAVSAALEERPEIMSAKPELWYTYH